MAVMGLGQFGLTHHWAKEERRDEARRLLDRNLAPGLRT